MITIEQHIQQSQGAIKTEAAKYAKTHGISLGAAIAEVTDEYRQGWYEGAEAARHDDRDFDDRDN